MLQAADGAAALEVARGHEGEIHLLVTDMVMPGMSGRDLAGRLPALRTALASEHSAFVAKPFTPEVFTDRVRELLATAEAGAA